jgi:hypothetical protein
LPEPVDPVANAAPHPAQLERRGLPELRDGEDAGAVEPLLHAFADAVDLLQFEAQQNLRQVVFGDNDQPVGLLQVGTDFAEKDIRRDADRTGQAFADLLAQRPLELQRQGAGDRHLPLIAHQPAGDLVDRHHLLDRHAGVDRRQHPLVILGVEPVPRLHRDHSGTNLLRLVHERAGRDAEALGLVAGGDRAGRAGQRLHDDDRLPAQGRVILLLARREEGVEVEEQPLDGVGGR